MSQRISQWWLGMRCKACKCVRWHRKDAPRVCPECGKLDMGWQDISIREIGTPVKTGWFGTAYTHKLEVHMFL